MRPQAGKAIVAGLVATAVMMPALYALVSVLAGRSVTSAMLGGIVAWMSAIIVLFINGSVTLPLIYVSVAYRLLPGDPWQRSALWGFILWCLAEIIVMPIMEDALTGVTSAWTTAILVLGLLFAFFVYGALLGWLAGAEPPRSSRVRETETERLAA